MNKDKTLQQYTTNDEIRLHAKTRALVEYFFAHPNSTQKEIAKLFELSEGRVSAILRSRKVIQAYPVLARRKVRAMVPKAVARFEKLIDQTRNDKVALDAVRDVLKSEKILEPQEIKISGTIEQKPTDELMRILEQTRQINGPVVDAEVVQDDDAV